MAAIVHLRPEPPLLQPDFSNAHVLVAVFHRRKPGCSKDGQSSYEVAMESILIEEIDPARAYLKARKRIEDFDKKFDGKTISWLVISCQTGQVVQDPDG